MMLVVVPLAVLMLMRVRAGRIMIFPGLMGVLVAMLMVAVGMEVAVAMLMTVIVLMVMRSAMFMIFPVSVGMLVGVLMLAMGMSMTVRVPVFVAMVMFVLMVMIVVIVLKMNIHFDPGDAIFLPLVHMQVVAFEL
jgi:hypothetical protein